MDPENQYPVWTCHYCAILNNGRVHKDDASIIYHTDICDVCNCWTLVTHPEEFNSPKFTLKRDKYKIYSELMEALDKVMEVETYDYSTAIHLIYCLDEIIHEILESRGFNDSVRTIRKNERRVDRKKIREVASTARKSQKESICQDIFSE